MLALADVHTHSAQLTAHDDVKLKLGGSDVVLDHDLVFPGLAAVDVRHYEEREALAGHDGDVASSWRQRHSAVIPRHRGNRPAGRVDGQCKSRADLHVLWAVVSTVDEDRRGPQ